ncbi:MAG TPA: antitoxin family protein [Gemmataceae bacterium]|jgi:predicted DNA-binding antitoxin AbrB/MazE fold protein|nr:antitoxin family protein [Gemmataceae bacterium]
MPNTVHAIFENGVFRPTGPVDLPDRCEVEFEPRAVGNSPNGEGPGRPNWEELYAILGRRVETGEPDLAARHDEHQP